MMATNRCITGCTEGDEGSRYYREMVGLLKSAPTRKYKTALENILRISKFVYTSPELKQITDIVEKVLNDESGDGGGK